VTRRYVSARRLRWQKLPLDSEAGTDKVCKSTRWHEPCFGDKLSQPWGTRRSHFNNIHHHDQSVGLGELSATQGSSSPKECHTPLTSQVLGKRDSLG